MKTALTIVAAIVMPGGLIVLAVALVTFLLARHHARLKAMPQEQPLAA